MARGAARNGVALEHDRMLPMPRLEGPEEVFRMNLIQYYRGWLGRRPRIPSGISPRRVREILGMVYTSIPQHLVAPRLRQGASRIRRQGEASTSGLPADERAYRGGPPQAQPQS